MTPANKRGCASKTAGGRASPLIGITMDIEGGYLRLKRQYISAIINAGGIVTPAYEGSAQLIDGLLIPGGDDLDPSYYNETQRFHMKLIDRQRTELEINLIHEIIQLRKPLLGICYGMQVINVALGGSLYQDIKSELPMAIDHKKASHGIEIKGAWGPLPKGRYMVNSFHHQAIKSLGRGLYTLASSDDGLIEAFYMKGYPFLLGVGWHPERQMAQALSNRIFTAFVKAAYANK